MAYDSLDPAGDPFYPPPISTLVFCLHCKQEYDSYRIEWRVLTDTDGKQHGFWCCPIEGCGGKGFGFDILPVDPTYQDERGGWIQDDDDVDDNDDESDEDVPLSDEAPSSNAPDDDEALPW